MKSQVENLSNLASKEVQSFATEYDHHFKDVYPTKFPGVEKSGRELEGDTSPLLEQIWKSRIEKG